MCTLIVAVRHFPRLPLLVAANRDERYDRPASAVHRWAGERFVAPRDDEAGGTWLGVNDQGLFVGITNRSGAVKDDARESRGVLVVEALRAASASGLHASLAALRTERFNAFHLLYADTRAAFVTWSDGASVSQQELAPGTHIVTERSLGGDDRERTELVRQRLGAIDRSRVPDPESIEALLKLHGAPHPLGGTCVHVPEVGYGTRSSAVYFGAERVEDSRLYWAEGQPCTATYEDRSALVRSLGPR
ncbi:MAG TPA: NRDE family protein [Polyangiaceae bacterium]